MSKKTEMAIVGGVGGYQISQGRLQLLQALHFGEEYRVRPPRPARQKQQQRLGAGRVRLYGDGTDRLLSSIAGTPSPPMPWALTCLASTCMLLMTCKQIKLRIGPRIEAWLVADYPNKAGKRTTLMSFSS